MGTRFNVKTSPEKKGQKSSVKFITAPKFYDRIELNSQFEFIRLFPEVNSSPVEAYFGR